MKKKYIYIYIYIVGGDKEWDKDGGINYSQTFYSRIEVEADVVHLCDDIIFLMSIGASETIHNPSHDYESRVKLSDKIIGKLIEKIKNGLTGDYEIIDLIDIKPAFSLNTVRLYDAKYENSDGEIVSHRLLWERTEYAKKLQSDWFIEFKSHVWQFIDFFAVFNGNFDKVYCNLSEYRMDDSNYGVGNLMSKIRKHHEKQYFIMKELVEQNYIKCDDYYTMHFYDLKHAKLKININIEATIGDLRVGTVEKSILSTILAKIFKEQIFKEQYRYMRNIEDDWQILSCYEYLVDDKLKTVEELLEELKLPQIKHLKKWIEDNENNVQYSLGYYTIKGLRPIDWAYLFQDKKFYLWLQKKDSLPKQLGAEYFYA